MAELKALREKAGLTQEELARNSGVSYKAIQAYEQGWRDIRKAKAIQLVRIATALGITIDELMKED